MSGDGRDESSDSGSGDATARGPVPPQVPSQGGRASVPPGGHPADGTVPAQRDWREDSVLPPPREMPPSDADLIDRMRAGDDTAYEELYRRHAQAVRRYARTCCRDAHTADDLTAEVFARMLQAVRRGSGPEHAVRAYLLTSVRRLQVDRFRAGARLHTTDDMEAFDPGVPFRDTAVEGFESEAAARAFASLPERWQLVLWHTEVEGDKPADIAPMLGMSANSVSALAYRAREGLRQAFLTQHVAELEQDDCRWTHGQLGAYVRDAISRRDSALEHTEHLHERLGDEVVGVPGRHELASEPARCVDVALEQGAVGVDVPAADSRDQLGVTRRLDAGRNAHVDRRFPTVPAGCRAT